MGVPQIATYAMPEPAEFFPNKMSWKFEPSRAVLLIHDMQRYFLDFYPAGSPLITQLVETIAHVKRFCEARGIPVVYTAQPVDQSPEDRGLLNDMWGRGIDNKPELKDIVPELAPTANDVVMTKWRYSAFQKADLERFMADRGKDQLLICGVYGHIGCLMTAVNAFMLNIKSFMIGDAIADFSREDHLWTLKYVATRCGKVVSAQELEHS